ncbi:MAG: hypothetical protein ACI9TK_000032 [Flavobacteriaceae bacterium]|jgi:hypothetical protein|tara:strand:- start:8054 stop:8533 length:480 start_codon:yes stop_codon:yes gene_type:complete
MKSFKVFRITLLTLSLIFFLSCGKEELIPTDDRIVGEWTIYSYTDLNKAVIIWGDLKASIVALYPENSCFSFKLSVNAKLATETFVNFDENSGGCLNPSLNIFTWLIDPATDLYTFTRGEQYTTNVVSFSNNDNRITVINQLSGETRVWDRIVAGTSAD